MYSKEQIIKMVLGALEEEAYKSEQEITSSWLNEQLQKCLSMPSIMQGDLKVIEKRFREKFNVTIGEAIILTDNDIEEDWFTEKRKEETDWYYWNRYSSYAKSKDLPRNILKRTDSDTDEILARLGDPKSKTAYHVKGMVVGDVQSGKTNNYTALINKAADIGYKLIIILTGTVEDLRSQTQERLDKDFVGSISIAGRATRDRETKYIGVGILENPRLPYCLTDQQNDIEKTPRNSIAGINDPILVVTKKNTHKLNYLLKWLKSEINAKNGYIEQPILIIDDEADNASVNTGNPEEDPKKINRLIREVINTGQKVSYVAYTATPFANIFIDPDSDGDIADTEDLFPKDFIVALNASSSYHGASYFFNEDPSNRICNIIDDAENHLPLVHKTGVSITSIPKSLINAIGVFLLACAVKDLRRKKLLITNNDYDSMLINMSRLTAVQSDLEPFIKNCLDEYWNAITLYSNHNNCEQVSSTMADLYALWNENYAGTINESWKEVCQALSTMEEPKVITIHSKSGNTLKYDQYGPKKQIIIGGSKLSRGLTLEGLVVSYFYRRSVMYDSLMQMGRWYGYREGYKDLLKLWLTSESLDWYFHILEATEDLRRQIAEMKKKKMTPRQFGLRVRASPDALMVTAVNKMKTSTRIVTQLRFDDKLLETDCVDSRPEIIQKNLDIFSDFIQQIAAKERNPEDIPDSQKQHLHFLNISADIVIDCLEKLTNHPSCGFWADNSQFIPFLNVLADNDAKLWDVFVFQLKKSSEERNWIDKNGRQFIRVNRTVVDIRKNANNKNELRLNANSRLTDKGIEALGLTKEEIEEINEKFNGKPPADKIYRRKRNKPSIIFHIVNAVNKNGLHKTTVLGWVISIPPSNHAGSEVRWEVTRDWFERYGTQLTDESEI